jgi:hypothetical protein
MDATRYRKTRIVAWLVAAAAIGGAFIMLSHRHAQAESRPERADEAALQESNVMAATLSARANPERASDGIAIMPPGPRDPVPAGPVHPHPITPEHQRIFGENRLISALNGAVDAADAPALRRVLADYSEQYPEDAQDVQGGYAVIADCLEHPGESSRSAAERWSDEHHGSTVRRFVIRHCLAK